MNRAQNNRRVVDIEFQNSVHLVDGISKSQCDGGPNKIGVTRDATLPRFVKSSVSHGLSFLNHRNPFDVSIAAFQSINCFPTRSGKNLGITLT